MSKTCKIIAMLIYRDASAKYLPGQFLWSPQWSVHGGKLGRLVSL